MKKQPKTGWHSVYCECGEDVGIVSHFGGKEKIKECRYCRGLTHTCQNCIIKSL